MKIGFFSPTINKTGGGELVTLNMIKALEKKSHKIVVYTAEKINYPRLQNFLGDKLHIDEVIISPNNFDPYAIENIYPNLFKSFLFKQKCDLLIDTFSNALFPWTDALYFQGSAKIDRLPKGFKGFLCAPYKAFLIRNLKEIKPEEKTLMTCSQFVAKEIKSQTGSYVHVLYPPISDYFKIQDNLFPKSDYVVTVTRIAQDKRPESIPLIANLVSDNIPFVIIGSCRTPSELENLKKLQKTICSLGLEKRVKLLLNISREKQRAVLQKAKVYLHPYVPYEAFGISVAEAMSAGCVPIVPDVGGLKEIVPKQLRYHSLEEAASLVKESLANWTPSKMEYSIEIADKFSTKEFSDNFLKLMNL